MGRTLFALILRESRVRYGRSRLGYAWALIEPVLIVAVISLFFAGVFGRREFSYDAGIFYALGVVNFQFFRHASQFVAQGLQANRALLNYPPVHEVDVLVARMALDAATYIVINLATFGFLVAMFGAHRPEHPDRLLLSYGGLALLAFGIGLNLAALFRRSEMALQIYGLLTAPLFLFSCVIFSYNSVPTEFQKVLVWNPVMHGVEGIRSGYYANYALGYVDFGYLYFVALALTGLGLFQVLVTRRGMR